MGIGGIEPCKVCLLLEEGGDAGRWRAVLRAYGTLCGWLEPSVLAGAWTASS